MTTVSDSFTGSGALSGNWATVNGTVTFARSSGNLVVTAGGGTGGTQLIWTANTFTGDQFCEFTIKANGTYGIAPMLRCNSSVGPDSYMLVYDGSIIAIDRNVSGTITNLGGVQTVAFAVNDVIRYEATGAGGSTVTLTVKKNGTSVFSTTDSAGSSLSGNYIGATTYSFDAGAQVTSFNGGDLGGATHKLFRASPGGVLSGLGSSGPFFKNPL